jgi:NAD(P)-dependent dehydrogenase (short-subunit alcohol dehydrogenase family)
MLVEGERFGTIESKALRDSFATNAEGAFLLTQALAPRFAAGAKVVNLASTLGSIAATDSLYSPSYSISKAALNMATRLLALALESRRAIVVALCPGWVRTDMGGANAPLGAPESVAAMLRLVDALDESHTGSFLDEQGRPLDW